MKNLVNFLSLIVFAAIASPVKAELVKMGVSDRTKEGVYLDTGSIRSHGQADVQFSYQIGKDWVEASANCFNGIISPQKAGAFKPFQPNPVGATRNMYRQVCNTASPGYQAGADGDIGSRAEAALNVGIIEKKVTIVNVFRGTAISSGQGIYLRQSNGTERLATYDGHVLYDGFSIRDSDLRCFENTPQDYYCTKLNQW